VHLKPPEDGLSTGLSGDVTILSQIEGPVIGRIPHLFMRGFLWLRLIVSPHATQTPQHLNIAQP